MLDSNRTRLLGIWDDNDFGVNDGGKTNPIKHEQKRRFLKYMGEMGSKLMRETVDPQFQVA